MAYPPSAVERAMKVQGVIVRALNGDLTWLQVADILGRGPAASAACAGSWSMRAMPACSIDGASGQCAWRRKGERHRQRGRPKMRFEHASGLSRAGSMTARNLAPYWLLCTAIHDDRFSAWKG